MEDTSKALMQFGADEVITRIILNMGQKFWRGGWGGGWGGGRGDIALNHDMRNLIFHQQCIAAQWIVLRRTGGCLTCDCTSFLTIFQSYLDDGRVMMKYCVQWNPVYN